MYFFYARLVAVLAGVSSLHVPTLRWKQFFIHPCYQNFSQSLFYFVCHPSIWIWCEHACSKSRNIHVAQMPQAPASIPVYIYLDASTHASIPVCICLDASTPASISTLGDAMACWTATAGTGFVTVSVTGSDCLQFAIEYEFAGRCRCSTAARLHYMYS